MGREGNIDPDKRNYESPPNVESDKSQTATPEKKGWFTRVQERASKMAESVSTFGKGINEKISEVRSKHDTKLDSKFNDAAGKINTLQEMKAGKGSSTESLDEVQDKSSLAVNNLMEKITVIKEKANVVGGRITGFLDRQAEADRRVDASQKQVGAQGRLISEFQKIIDDRKAKLDLTDNSASYDVLSECYKVLRTSDSDRVHQANEVLKNAALPGDQRMLIRDIVTNRVRIGELVANRRESQASLESAQRDLQILRERRSGTARAEESAASDLGSAKPELA